MARNKIIDLRRSLQPQQSPIAKGLGGLISGLTEQDEKRKKKDAISKMLQDAGYDSQKAESYAELDDNMLRFALSQDAKQAQLQQKVQKEEREQASLQQMVEEAQGLTQEQKQVYVNLNPRDRKEYIKSLTPQQSYFGKLFSPTQHPLAPGQSQLSQGNIQQVVQQLKESGMEDEQIAQLIQGEQKVEQEEQGAFDPLRALGGAATGAAGAGGVRALSQLAPTIGSPLMAHSLADLGISAMNEIANVFGQGRPFPTVLEKAKEFQKIGDTAIEDIEKMAADIVEKKTGKRPDMKIEKIKPPLESLAKYTTIGGITEGLRDVAKSLGLEVDPRTPGEKKVAQAAGGLALLFDPKRATKEGIVNALKVAGIQVGAAEGAGLLGKVMTGNDLVDKGITFAGYMLAHRYPDALNKFKTEQFKKWDKAIDKADKPNISAQPIRKKLDAIEKGLEKGDPYTDAKKFVREKIVGTVRNAEKGGKYSPQDLDDVFKGLNKSKVYDGAQDNQVMSQWRAAKNAVSDEIDRWGNKNAPEALKSFRLANDISSTLSNRSEIADSVRRAAGSGIAISPGRLILKLVAKPAAAVSGELSRFLQSPGVRTAYFNVLKAGAKNNPEAIVAAGEKLAAVMKKKDKSLYDRLTKK